MEIADFFNSLFLKKFVKFKRFNTKAKGYLGSLSLFNWKFTIFNENYPICSISVSVNMISADFKFSS